MDPTDKICLFNNKDSDLVSLKKDIFRSFEPILDARLTFSGGVCGTHHPKYPLGGWVSKGKC